jgi:hypothetical protein
MKPLERAGCAATIPTVDQADVHSPDDPDSRLDEEMEESRREMIAREKRMTVEQRVQLFECLSRDAAAIRASAKRIR